MVNCSADCILDAKYCDQLHWDLISQTNIPPFSILDISNTYLVSRKMRKRLKRLDLQYGGLLFMKLNYPNHAPRHLRSDRNQIDFHRNHYLRMQRKTIYQQKRTVSCYCK